MERMCVVLRAERISDIIAVKCVPGPDLGTVNKGHFCDQHDEKTS